MSKTKAILFVQPIPRPKEPAPPCEAYPPTPKTEQPNDFRRVDVSDIPSGIKVIKYAEEPTCLFDYLPEAEVVEFGSLGEVTTDNSTIYIFSESTKEFYQWLPTS